MATRIKRSEPVRLVEGDISIDLGEVAISPAGNEVRSEFSISHGGLTELVGINEQVDINEYGDEVAVALGDTVSGEILTVKLISYETGTGAVQTPACRLFAFDANPLTTVGDTALTLAARRSIIGQIDVLAADWLSDANGASVFKTVSFPFHPVSTIYWVFQKLGASLNDAAGDDEAIQFDFWYRRDS